MKKICLLFFVILTSITFVFSGTLIGTVNYEGKAPKAKPLKMDADPVCGKSHDGKVYNESFILDKDKNLKNAMIWLKNAKYSGGLATEPVTIDQKGCIYYPHVQGIMKNQPVIIKNSDGTLHNIHSMADKNDQFNFAMPQVVKERKTLFDKAEDPFYIKCDVHPWMKTWVAIFDHPFFAVTDENGNFKIENIPAGEYEVIAWQEKFKMKKHLSVKVIITDKETKQNFTFVRPKKK